MNSVSPSVGKSVGEVLGGSVVEEETGDAGAGVRSNHGGTSSSLR
jgi:hypothetical protein